MSEPRKHHYLSQFYLKGFSFNPDDKIPQCFFYHIPSDSKISVSSVEDVASKRDLFTITWSNWEKDFSLEKEFSLEETNLWSWLITLINKIYNKQKLNEEDELNLIDLIIFKLKRSIIVSNQYREKTEKIKEQIKIELKKKYPDNKRTQEEYDKAMKNAMLVLIKQNKLEIELDKYDMIKTLRNRNWFFLKIRDNNKSFITSDLPLYRFNYPWESDWAHNPNTQIILPLSSKILLLIHWEWKLRRIVENNNSEFIKRANWMIISNASNFIIWTNPRLLQKMKEWKNWWTKRYLYPENVLFLSDEQLNEK